MFRRVFVEKVVWLMECVYIEESVLLFYYNFFHKSDNYYWRY